MKRTVLTLIAILLICNMAYTQEIIDHVVTTLDQNLNMNFGSWKYSESMNKSAYKKDFDDNVWREIKIGERLTPDSAWFRTELTIPETMLGHTINGDGKIYLTITVDDAGICWINGEKKGKFNWDGKYLLTEHPKPGEKYKIAIKAINTGGPMRLLKSSIEWDMLNQYESEIENFILSLRVGKKLLSDDTYLQIGHTKHDNGIDLSATPTDRRLKLRGILEQAARQVRLDALEKKDFITFYDSMQQARQTYAPVAEYAKEFIFLLDSNAHIDCAWLWRYLETINIAKNTFTSVINMMEARPDFTYSQSQAHLFWWIENKFPQLNKKIKERVADGRFELVGGMWVEPDCNLISGESWARQILYGKRYFKEKYGIDINIGWNPDSFGYNWNMPQIYRDSGIDAFITQKIGWNDTNMFPYRLFWWQGPDSTKILTYFPYNYVNDMKHPFQYVDWMRQFESNTSFKKMLILYGVGDHGGGPTPEMLDRINYLKHVDIYPKLEYSTAKSYLDWIRKHDLSNLPVWDDELYLEYHRGTYTTQSDTKLNNRLSEVKLGTTEQLASIANLYGHSYPHQNILDAWRHIMFNQFHDILPGSSIYPVYVDSDREYEEVFEIAKTETDKAIDFLIKKIDTRVKKNSIPVVVYNPLPWKRSDIAELIIEKALNTHYSVFDSQGHEIPSQITESDRYHHVILFVAKDVPSTGYAIYELRPTRSKTYESDLVTEKYRLANKFFDVVIDSKNGWLSSIYDKRKNREILDGPGNELQLFDDRPDAWDAWNIGLGEKFPVTFRGAEIVEHGPVRSIIRVKHDFLKPGVVKQYPTPNNPNSYFEQDIILYSDMDRIDFITHADWWEEHVMMKVAFDVTVNDSIATYEIPFGSIERPTTMNNDWEKARFEVSQQKWSDLTNPEHDYGVSLLNKAKYGGDIHDSVMRLSLLRSPKWPDPMADMGMHQMEYSLFPHTNCWKGGKTMQRAFEYNYPLISRVTTSHNGQWNKQKSFFSVDVTNVVLNTIKIAESKSTFEDTDRSGEQALILRLYEAYGVKCEATITLPENVKKAAVSNILEDEIENIPVDNNRIKLTFEPYKIKTIKIWF